MSVLAGIRVVELANERIAFAGKLLADMGADVILIEPPDGDPSRYARTGATLTPVYHHGSPMNMQTC